MNGGLGNQMFQYALYLALKEKGHSVKLDISLYDFVDMHNGYELGRVFGVKDSVVRKRGFYLYWLRLLLKGYFKSIITADKLVYDVKVMESPNKYIWGSWQSDKYFKSIEYLVRDKFVFKGVDEQNHTIAKNMQSCNSVSVHIRRGDYKKYGMTLINEDYYKKAIDYVCKNVISPAFFVFSDDCDEANALMDRIGVPYKLMMHNKGEDSFKDMYLMSQCKHNIVCNSSFSWWGAWLNDNEDKVVVAPKIWSERRTELRPQLQEWVLI